MATLAEVLRQAGYVTPQGQVVGPRTTTAQTMSNYIRNIIPNAAQNLAQQRSDIDAALTMGDQGIQVGDRAAFERQMAQVPNLMGLTAYHGTPHTIKGKFDISKVGTGEGAQAYGHGMYFAENPAVAKEYAEQVKDLAKLGKIWNQVEYAKQQLKKAIDAGNTEEALKFRDLRDKLHGWHSANNMMSKGNLYKVDIPDADIPKMLDYDRPIIEQPELYEIVRSNIKDPDILKTFEYNAKSGITGANVYQNYLGGKTPAEKSANALKMGIKGIRYLDEGSRGKATGVGFNSPKYSAYDPNFGGHDFNSLKEAEDFVKANPSFQLIKPTSNFVVFEPSDVKILEQNSKPLSRKEIIEQELEKVSK
jgi:hypothetical protein